MNSGEYRVEKIVKTKVLGNSVSYIVKWEGYEELSEEPETNSDIRALVDELWNEKVYDLLKVKTNAQREVYLFMTQVNPESRNVKRSKMIKKAPMEYARKENPVTNKQNKGSKANDSQSEFDPRDFEQGRFESGEDE